MRIIRSVYPIESELSAPVESCGSGRRCGSGILYVRAMNTRRFAPVVPEERGTELCCKIDLATALNVYRAIFAD